MRIAVCVDDTYGMLFGGRRQSKDRLLRARMLLAAGEGALWMNGYSAKQFEKDAPVRVHEEFLSKAGPDDLCFVENADIAPWARQIRQVILYRWNRKYPGDTRFPKELFEDRWTLESSVEFPGSSHDVITEEIYSL